MYFQLKLAEKILDRKIRETMGARLFSPSQFAYQKGKGCEAALHKLVEEIEKYKLDKTRKNISLITFIDIEGAFDNTSFKDIRSAAICKDIKPWIVNWMSSMLTSKKIKYKGSDTDESFTPAKGCPQGGCMSPLMWNLGCKVFGYADDLAIMVSGRAQFKAEIITKMNYLLGVVEKWCRSTGLSVNPSKSNYMKITNYIDNSIESVKMYNTDIPRTSSFKYLGVTIDDV